MKFTDKKPIYQQIADHFCRSILQKKWIPGDRIPSVRETAVAMEVNPNTAMRAFHYLQDHNIADKKRGVGYFVSERAYKEVLELKRAEFIEQDLPVFFRKMELLGYTCDELQEIRKKGK